MPTGPAYPSGVDVSISNPNSTLYFGDGTFVANEFTDGSRRLIIAPDNQIEVQERKSGVWNLTGLELSDETLHLGHGLAMSGLASSVVIRGVLNAEESLSLDIGFDATGSDFPRTSRVQARLNNIVTQPDSSTSFTGKILPILTTTFLRTYIYAIYVFVGDVVPTAPVTLTGRTGQTPGVGTLFYSKIFPQSMFTANTIARFELGAGIGVFPGIDISLTFSSDNDFSLRGTSGGVFFQAYDIQNYQYEELLSFNTGTDKLLVDIDGEVMVDYLGNVMSTDPAVGI